MTTFTPERILSCIRARILRYMSKGKIRLPYFKLYCALPFFSPKCSCPPSHSKPDPNSVNIVPKSIYYCLAAGCLICSRATAFLCVIVQPPQLTEITLQKIPSKFTRKYGVGLSNPVLLKPPDGTEWKVYWTKHVGNIWFQKGWKEFATYYSLDYGHLVLFNYEETSHFNVHIFDMSTLEINYPFHGTQDQKNNLEQIIDDSVEILDELAPCQKTRLKSPISCPQPCKKLRTDTRDVERSSNLEKLHQRVETRGRHSQRTNFEKSQESIEGDGVNCLDHKRVPLAESKINPTKKGEKETQKTPLPISPHPHITGALKEANKFTSKNPFFMVDIVQGYLEQNRPCVPVDFTRKYFNKKKQNVTLQLGKKLWPLKLLCYPYNTPSKLSSGWSLFVEESQLQVRDICIFELINREDAVFDVHIFRGDSYP